MRLLMILLLGIAALSAACETMSWPAERVMAGKIGCPSEEIQVTDTNHGLGFVATSWRATCRGQAFICSKSATGQNPDDISCTPEIPKVTYDNDTDPLGG